MTITLSIPPELEQRLTQAAARQGLPVEAYATRLLAQGALGRGPSGTRGLASIVDRR